MKSEAVEPEISKTAKVMSGCLFLIPLCHLGSMAELGVNWLNLAGLLYTSWLAWLSFRYLRTKNQFYKTLEDIGFQGYLGVGALIWMASSGFNWFLALFGFLVIAQVCLSVAALAKVAVKQDMQAKL